MKLLSLAVVATLGAGSTLAAETDSASTCRVFVLKRIGQHYTVEPVDLADNETRVFPANKETGIVDIIFSVGYGTSGSMAKWSEKRMTSVRCRNGELQVTDRYSEGKEWARPPRKLDDLARFDMRVSVTGADGTKQAFVILQYKEAAEEKVGPVVDIFSGRIPMSEGDYALCVDTYHHTRGAHVEGQAALEYDRWPLITAKLPDGTEGVFIVDIGAGTTVVSKKFLPPGTEIEEAAMVQYSSGGKKLLKYTPGGATGAVQSVVGKATLEELRFGDIRFKDARVDVLKEMPDMFGRSIVGILGMDLMRRCDVLSMSLTSDGGSTPALRMGRSATANGPNVLEVPFTFVNSHLTVDGKLNDSLVHFVMDTGAPDIIVDTEAAKRLGIKAEKKMRPGRGLDGGSASMQRGTPTDLTIAGRSFGTIQPTISGLPCFTTLRTNKQNAGLLGNTFFSRFKRFELDCERRMVLLVN